MSVQTGCPDPRKLSAIIDGTVSQPDLDQLTHHLEGCTCCQATLQRVASGEIPIEELVAGLRDSNPSDASALWAAITYVEQELSAQRPKSPDSVRTLSPATSDSESWDADLDFLDPPDDPAYLGKLHHFQIAHVIGRGGMGIVLEGFDTHLQRRVAIKVMNPRFQENEVARQRFCREARAAAAISHEHVVPMHHVAKAQEDKVAYLVMQLIEGDTLENRMADGRPLPAADVARIGMQVAAGLSAAHARDMVHRDIKPANILIEAETNRVKLTDFGLARATDDIKLTQTGMVTGTPLYMSPEQAMGGTADERSDLFSLGVVMYEMATGVSPFEAPTAVGVMKRILDEDPEPPYRLNASITPPLSDLIMALVSKAPEDRPESAANVATALASIVSEFGPISPLQVPAVAAHEVKKISGRHRKLRNRWIIAAWCAAALGLIGIATTLAILLSSPGRNSSDALSLESPFPSIVLPNNPGPVWSVDFSPNGNEIVAAIEDGSVRVWDIETQKVIKSFNAHRGIVWMVQFHATRPIVATAGDDGSVKLWNSETFAPIFEWREENAIRGIAFSPDGKRIAAGGREGVIHIYDIDTHEEIQSKTQPGAIFGIDYSPDGRLIATVGSDKVVRLWEADSLEERQTMPGHDGPIYNVRFAEHGALLASVGWNKEIRLWNVDTGTQAMKLVGSNGDIWATAFCGSSNHLVTGGHDGVTRVWDLNDGSIIATIRGHESAVHNISLDPTRHRIATASRDGSIRVWDLTSLSE